MKEKNKNTFGVIARKVAKAAAITGGVVVGGAALLYAWIGVGVTQYADRYDPENGIHYICEMSKLGWKFIQE